MGMDYVLVSAALSDQDGTGQLSKIRIDGGQISHSSLTGKAGNGETEAVTTLRLDTFMKSRDDPKPYLLKLDVDGFEIPIMQGTEGIWDDISCVIVEATLDTFAERMNYVLSKGFKLFDIVDICYYYNMFSQADLVFLAGRLMDNPNLRPWQTKTFTWKEWVPVASF